MKRAVLACFFGLFLVSCDQREVSPSVSAVNWKTRQVDHASEDSSESGTTYLSVYSQIYSQTEKKTHDLTATVSIRNTSRMDAVFIEKIDHFDTHGTLVRAYIDKPISVAPMETLEIVIAQKDNRGGTGGNFLFDWKIKPNSSEPHFEAVMISTSGQQGLSFLTQGKRVR